MKGQAHSDRGHHRHDGGGGARRMRGRGRERLKKRQKPGADAATLGCTGVTTSEVELFAQDEVTCDYQGGSLTIVTFASSDQVQRWLSAASTLAGKTGTMVVGPTCLSSPRRARSCRQPAHVIAAGIPAPIKPPAMAPRNTAPVPADRGGSLRCGRDGNQKSGPVHQALRSFSGTTNVPHPGRTTTRPSLTRSAIALRIVPRARPVSC
jgi:hypothetical protein